MGNSNEGNKFIDFTIKLDKICYFPGENISGTLNLMGKPGLLETQLTDPKVKFVVNEILKFIPLQHSNFSNYPSDIINNNSNFLVFNTFIGANLLTTIHIPFSVNLPIYSSFSKLELPPSFPS